MKNYNWVMAPETLGPQTYWQQVMTPEHRIDFLYRYYRWKNPMSTHKEATEFAMLKAYEWQSFYDSPEIRDLIRFHKTFAQTDSFVSWISKWRME